MTLTITLASTTAIYQASDFRLTYAVAGSAADTSFKSLAVGSPKWAGWTWSALITYSGLGQVGVTDTSQWLFSLLKEKAHTISLNDAIELICTRWPGFVRRTRQDWDHTFIIGAFDDDTARVLMLSNSTRLNPHCPGGTERLPEILNDLAVTEDAPSDGSVYITGSGAPYILAESNELARLSKRLSRDPSGTRLIFQRLSSVTKIAAARTSTVSEGCWCASLTADGSGAGSVFGIPGARYTPPTLRYPLPDSVAMERVIEDLQQNVLRPQREALVDFTRKKCAEFATELNRERKKSNNPTIGRSGLDYI